MDKEKISVEYLNMPDTPIFRTGLETVKACIDEGIPFIAVPIFNNSHLVAALKLTEKHVADLNSGAECDCDECKATKH